jgi:hypothetical protein
VVQVAIVSVWRGAAGDHHYLDGVFSSTSGVAPMSPGYGGSD